MRTSPTNSLIEQLRRAVLLPDSAAFGDAVLLGRFIERHDEAAFAVLVNRHGPMVWGVCRRLLHQHDAEDAFQATFLVLARKAASIRSKEMVGNWLYGVAYQTALQARRTAARRRAKEVQVTTMPDIEAGAPDPWADIQPLLDQELSRLPDIYRAVIVLCDLEGRTRREVASHLGIPEGTVAARVARGRTMLAKRLAQRGVSLTGGALAAVLAQEAASAGVPKSVVASTIKAATLIAAGKAAGTGAISVKAAALTEGVLKAMLFTKLKAVITVMMILGFLATGATLLTYRAAAGQDEKKPIAEKPVEPAPKQVAAKEAFTAWGKEVGGLQAGLGFRLGEHRAYQHGETVTLVLRVRNVSKEAVKFSHLLPFIEQSLTVTDSDGKPVPQPKMIPGIGERDVGLEELPPGKEIELYELQRQLRPASESSTTKEKSPVSLYGTGKVSIRYDHVLGPPEMGLPRWKLDPVLSKLATGKLQLEVKEPEKVPQKQEKEKEAFTAWGKEVSGLQAGLGFRPGEQRAYHQGETVKLVLRVRNVSKKTLKFSYIRPFEEHSPTVTDSDGKAVPQPDVLPDVGIHLPGEEEVAPGKEIELYELQRQLRPASESSTTKEKRPVSLYGTGKVRIQYDHVLGPPEMGRPNWTLDPILSKLATGMLELDVKEPETVPQKQEKEKEPFTAWGKEVGGLQAGLGFRSSGEHRAYHHGETATVILRVRNIAKKAVEFEHIYGFFLENPPKVTDADGKVVELRRGTDEGKQFPRTTSIAPGKEVELYEWKLDLQPKGGINKGLFTIHGTGKVGLQCERIVGPTSGNPNHPNPTLDKLATGKLELEVKAISSRPRPKEPGEPEAASKNESADPELKRLTPQHAKKLLPEAASVRYEDFEAALEKRELPKANQSPTHFVLTFRPPKELPKDADKDFEWTTDTINPNAVAKALTVSKGKGFASIIQEDYIKECTCESDDQKAQGRVRFKCDLYSGCISFKANMVKGQWVIQEFEWPHFGVRFIRGVGENWMQEKITPEKSGKLEPQVKDAGNLPQKQEKEKKEGFTAWGKEVGGLQAGLGFKPGEKRTYHPGETVTLVIRVRNVGKEAVNVRYHPEFFDYPAPAVTDSKGKPITLERKDRDGGVLDRPVEVKLAPGKEIEIAEFKFHARLATQRASEGEEREWTLYGTGKFQIQYERVMWLETDPNLSKLSTGKLELDVKEAEKLPEKDAEPEPTEEQLTRAKTEYAKHGARYSVYTDEERKQTIPTFALLRSKADADIIGLPDLPFHFRLLLTCSEVTDIGMKEVKKLKHLTQLSLVSTKITDTGLKELKDSPNLTKLYLDNTNVTDAGLKHLHGLKDLTELSLGRTKVTDEGVKELQEVLPKCKIRR